MHAFPRPLMTTLRRPGVVWLALWIALLLPLVPTLSHVLAWARAEAARVEICSTTGQRWVVLDQAQADAAHNLPRTSELPSAPASAQGLNHCPFCLLSADHTATPPQDDPGPFVLPGQSLPPQRRQVFISLLSFVLAPPPRGPPAVLNF